MIFSVVNMNLILLLADVTGEGDAGGNDEMSRPRKDRQNGLKRHCVQRVAYLPAITTPSKIR
jgi:hypothetical protein